MGGLTQWPVLLITSTVVCLLFKGLRNEKTLL